MKKLLLFGLFFCGSLIAANAQCTAAKSACCASKKTASVDASTQTGSLVKEVSVSGPNVQIDAAEQLASSDPTIQKRQDSETGAFTYYQKSTNAKGKTVWNEVKYCSDSQKFTSLADAHGEKKADKMTEGSDKKEGAACCSSKKGDKMAEGSDKKEGAACCASKKVEGTK